MAGIGFNSRPIALAAIAAGAVIFTPPVCAQPAPFQGRAMRVSPGPRGGRVVQPAQAQPSQPNKNDEAKPEEKKEGESKKEDKDKNKEGDESKSDGPVKRPEEPPRAPDPRELDVRPDDNGRVKFGFYGQPWPDVLQWLANVSNQSLDWQELPSGYLNLSTQRSYTIPEARNLINGRLQARGYTLLLVGEVLSVAKIDKLDPSLVPRVNEEDLYDRQPNDIVKITFDLPGELEPKQAVEDVKQALSPNAKAMPLAATRRLLLIDTVANLRMVSALLNEERIEQQGQEIPRSFRLRHARAEKVINTLYVVLGLDPAAQPSQMELQIQQQKMQLLMQMQGAGKDISKMLNKDGPKVYLAFNRHENSILVNAPEREMKIIERTINFLDIPAPGSTLSNGDGAADAARYATTYELETIDPRTLLSTLEEIGDLDPLTELRADNQAKILFVRGSESDHEKVSAMIKQLDRSDERFRVFWLRPDLPADAVAGSILALLGEEKKDDDSNRRRYYFYSWRGNEEEDTDETTLRVTADIESNRLLVRGSEEQVAQVEELLEEMDALAVGRSTDRPIVVTDPLDPADADRLIEQLRRLWPTMGGDAELLIEEGAKPPEKKPAPAPSASLDKQPATPVAGAPESPFRLLAAPIEEETAEERPAVSVTVTPDGRLLIGGNDPQAVARLQRIIESLSPRPDQFKEFVVKYASAFYIHWKLEDYFEDELKGGDEAGNNNRYYYFDYDPSDKKETASLSRRKKLRLIYNSTTNSIVAANATTEQLETIGRLIDTWDQPPREDNIVGRRTGMVKVRYSRAKVIAEALKEVYRDLLSSRDKEFDTQDEKGSGYTLPRTTEIEFSGVSGAVASKTKPIEVGFDGALSIGVDEIANMLVISAEKELYDSVVAMIQTLDTEARSLNTVQVVRTGVSAKAVREALAETLGTPWVGGKPEKAEPQQQQQDGNQQPGGPQRQRGDRGDRRGRGRN